MAVTAACSSVAPQSPPSCQVPNAIRETWRSLRPNLIVFMRPSWSRPPLSHIPNGSEPFTLLVGDAPARFWRACWLYVDQRVLPMLNLEPSPPPGSGSRELDKIRVLIVDDHAVVRQGLRMFLGLDPDIEVVGEAADGREAVRLAQELQPQEVLMELLMPVMDGRTAIETIRRQMPEVEVIALTSVLDDASVTGAIRAGAIGYLLKNSDADELRRAIRAAAQGQVHLSPEAAARLVKEIQIPGSPESLTERETSVLRLLARGQANKQIARELKIGEQTVKTHVSRILGKLQLQSRTAAALYALDRGLVSAGDVGHS